MKSVPKFRRFQSAFTLIEIMIVVLIIGIILAVAVPSFVHARESSRGRSCVANLKEIDTAKEQYAMDNRLMTGDNSLAADPLTVTGSTLVGSTNYIKTAVVCPSTGAYTVGAIGTLPTCSIGANATIAPFAPHVLQ